MSAQPSEWTHEDSYRGRGVAAAMHRRRLRALIALHRSLDIPEGAAVADFGCSNGFILAVLQREVFRDRVARIHGFDHADHLIALARDRNLPNACFDRFDLNQLDDTHRGEFDVVTCFETLEHVGNVENAFDNLVRTCKPGGTIVVSLPNERGVPGLVKFFGRKLLRRNAYGDFFDECSEREYVSALLSGRRIDVFRQPPAPAWGPHLGFDWQVVFDFIRREYLDTARLELERRIWAALRFGVFLVMRKL
jgi:SAM-dependent methyltransferase